jgi:glutamate synthase domain-containing protein 2
MSPLYLPFSPRFITLTLAVLATLLFGAWLYVDQRSIVLAVLLGISIFLVIVGIVDLFQTSHAILRNYPIAAHIRFILEHIRPELRQYFFEAERDGTPFPRDKRALVYQRAKQQLDTRPFGTHYDVYRDHYEWLHHSIQPKQPASELFRTTIGGAECTKPYSASVFNISAMSYGSLSANAIRALNKGAKLGRLCP